MSMAALTTSRGILISNPVGHGRSSGRSRNKARLLFDLAEGIAGASSAGRILGQEAALDQIVDVTASRILRSFGELRPLRGGQLPLEAVEQPVDDLALTFVDRLAGMRFPKLG